MVGKISAYVSAGLRSSCPSLHRPLETGGSSTLLSSAVSKAEQFVIFQYANRRYAHKMQEILSLSTCNKLQMIFRRPVLGKVQYATLLLSQSTDPLGQKVDFLFCRQHCCIVVVAPRRLL